MALIPLTSGAYQSESVIANAQRCVNLYPEVNPKSSTPPVPVTHYPRPGKVLIGTLLPVVHHYLADVAETLALVDSPSIQCYQPPLDVVAGAMGAYSTRRLRSAYLGKALRVIRSSDNTELDIGFINCGDLDIPAMLAFCGAGAGITGRMLKWYDQSGNGRDIQAVALSPNGPRLVNTGAVAAVINGRCAPLTVAGTLDTFMEETTLTSWFATTGGTVFAVARSLSGGNTNTVFPATDNKPLFAIGGTGGGANSGMGRMDFVSSVYPGAPAMYTRRYLKVWFDAPPVLVDTVVSYSFGTDAIFTMRFNTGDPTPNKAYVNGGSPGTNASPTASFDTNGLLNVMGYAGDHAGSQTFDGQCGEFILWNNELSLSDSNYMGNNQKDYWGPSWSNISV